MYCWFFLVVNKMGTIVEKKTTKSLTYPSPNHLPGSSEIFGSSSCHISFLSFFLLPCSLRRAWEIEWLWVIKNMGFAHWQPWFKFWLCLLLAACVCKLSLSVASLCDPKDCSPPGSFVLGIPQARILMWVTVSYSRASSWPRDQTQISCVSCIGRQILPNYAPWEALLPAWLWQIL